MTLLDGKVAIVTGSGSGVGRGVCIALARAGARVVVSSRTVAKCDVIVDEIESAGGVATAAECDVTLPAHIDACVAQTLDAYGAIDVLVNAADDPRVDVPFLDLTEEVMMASWRTGVMGTVRFTQACVPAHARPAARVRSSMSRRARACSHRRVWGRTPRHRRRSGPSRVPPRSSWDPWASG